MTTEIWMQKCRDHKTVENFRREFSDEEAEILWAKLIEILKSKEVVLYVDEDEVRKEYESMRVE